MFKLPVVHSLCYDGNQGSFIRVGGRELATSVMGGLNPVPTSVGGDSTDSYIHIYLQLEWGEEFPLVGIYFHDYSPEVHNN